MGYFEDVLDGILENGADSDIVKPDLIGIHNVKGLVLERLMLWELCLEKELAEEDHSEFYRKLIRAKEMDVGIRFEQKKAYLDPLGFDRLDQLSDPHADYLAHIGSLFGTEANNLTNLRERGVFGNPDPQYPTYLMRHASGTTTLTNGSLYGISLFIDKTKLCERRTVFIDPESITEDGWLRDVLGHSYFIVGGIPREAIVEYTITGQSIRGQS